MTEKACERLNQTLQTICLSISDENKIFSNNGRAHVLLSLIKECSIKKVSQFIMLLKLTYTKPFIYMNKIVFCGHRWMFQARHSNCTREILCKTERACERLNQTLQTICLSISNEEPNVFQQCSSMFFDCHWLLRGFH